jgi:hypothetical protein
MEILIQIYMSVEYVKQLRHIFKGVLSSHMLWILIMTKLTFSKNVLSLQMKLLISLSWLSEKFLKCNKSYKVLKWELVVFKLFLFLKKKCILHGDMSMLVWWNVSPTLYISSIKMLINMWRFNNVIFHLILLTTLNCIKDIFVRFTFKLKEMAKLKIL